MLSTVCYLFFQVGNKNLPKEKTKEIIVTWLMMLVVTLWKRTELDTILLLSLLLFSAIAHVVDRVRVNFAKDLCHKMLVDGKSVAECLMVKDACLQFSLGRKTSCVWTG